MVQASRAIVTGAGGFIGHHLVTRLMEEGVAVRGVDLVRPRWEESRASEFLIKDLRDPAQAAEALSGWGAQEVYALAADMGGMGYIKRHDGDILTSNLAISLNTASIVAQLRIPKIIYASSACVYPNYRQTHPMSAPLAEGEAYPADPQDGYGWEKLTTEKLLTAYHHEGRVQVRIARLHNIYGPQGTYDGGREKAPAALCRKIAEARDGGEIEVWGNGVQTRSFCYIDDAVEGICRLADSGWHEPLNIGSSEMVTIGMLVSIIARIAGKRIRIRYAPGAPVGVMGRNSDNTLIRGLFEWEPSIRLEAGMQTTYRWVEQQVRNAR